jgi:hypothetical protein
LGELKSDSGQRTADSGQQEALLANWSLAGWPEEKHATALVLKSLASAQFASDRRQPNSL